MILITGASGTAGSAVLQSAKILGLPVTAMYRTSEDAKKAPPGIATVIADYSDKDSLPKALAGIDSVYLVCGPIPQLVELETNMIEACKSAGVRHIVLNSALGAGDFQKSFPSWHFKVEQVLKSCGISFTIIRPNGFMQNIVTYSAATIKNDNAFYAAMGEARTSLIDIRDIGDVVAKILSDPQAHIGKTYELNGPEAVSNYEIAERISNLVGRKISFVDIPENAQRTAMSNAGMPEWQVTAILELQEYYKTGRCASVDGQVAKLLGHSERRLDTYLSETVSSFLSQAA